MASSPRSSRSKFSMSLRTATEFIVLTLALNKIPALYGLLALFTGHPLNRLQLTHYLYSLLILALLCNLAPAIRAPRESKAAMTKVLALAWLYVVDTLVNSFYTLFFGLSWFALISQQFGEMGINNAATSLASTSGVQSGNTTATFPSSNELGVTATPGLQLTEKGNMASLVVLALLWFVRMAFCAVLLAYARTRVRGYIVATIVGEGGYGLAGSPYREGKGSGWEDWFGSGMLRLPSRTFWLGGEQERGDVEAKKGLKVSVAADGGERRAKGAMVSSDKQG